MQPKSEQQQLAKELYLNTDKTQQEIADILNVHRRTIYLWMKNGKWEEMKIAIRQAPAVIINDIYNHFDAINQRIYNRTPDERCPTMEEVNMMYKLLKMSNTISRQHTGAYMEAYTELLKFINKKDHELAKKVTNLADQYVMGNVLNSNTAFEDMMKVRMDLVMNNLENYEKTQLPDTPEAPCQTSPVTPPPPLGDNGEGRAEAETQSQNAEITSGTQSQIPNSDQPNTNPNSQFQIPNSRERDVIMCANDVTMSHPSSICPKPALIRPHEGNVNISLSQNDTEKIFPENVTIPPVIAGNEATQPQIPNSNEPNTNPNSEFPIPNSKKRDVIMCANDVTMSHPSSICTKPAIAKPHEGNGNISLSQNDTEKIFPENVTMPPVIAGNSLSRLLGKAGQLQTANCQFRILCLPSTFLSAHRPSAKETSFGSTISMMSMKTI